MKEDRPSERWLFLIGQLTSWGDITFYHRFLQGYLHTILSLTFLHVFLTIVWDSVMILFCVLFCFFFLFQRPIISSEVKLPFSIWPSDLLSSNTVPSSMFLKPSSCFLQITLFFPLFSHLFFSIFLTFPSVRLCLPSVFSVSFPWVSLAFPPSSWRSSIRVRFLLISSKSRSEILLRQLRSGPDAVESWWRWFCDGSTVRDVLRCSEGTEMLTSDPRLSQDLSRSRTLWWFFFPVCCAALRWHHTVWTSTPLPPPPGTLGITSPLFSTFYL